MKSVGEDAAGVPVPGEVDGMAGVAIGRGGALFGGRVWQY